MALQSKLKRIAAGWDAALDAGVYQTAENQLDLQNQITPRATGDLAGSERIEPARGTGGGRYQVIAGGTIGPKRRRMIDYAAPVEARRPYAEPAAKQLNPALRPAEHVRALIRRNRV